MFARAMDKFLSFFNYYYLEIPNNLLPPPYTNNKSRKSFISVYASVYECNCMQGSEYSFSC